MPFFSRKGHLAVATVLDIALHGTEVPVSAKDLSKRLSLPPRHLEPLLQALVREGLLTGRRGPSGGYRLGGDPGSMTCAAIFRAAITPLQPSGQPQTLLIQRVVDPALSSAEQQFLTALSAITVQDLMNRAKSAA